MADCSNVHELKSFLGIANYFSPYIEAYADIAAPLYRLLRNDVPFKWTPYLSRIQFLLKILFAQAPTLTLVDHKKPYVVYSDASITAVGAVLMQKDSKGALRPIWFASRGLLAAEKNYPVQELELLALMFARKKFSHYLEEAEWACFTDHQAIVNIMSSNSTSPRIQRWKLALASENLTVYHVPGKDNVVADALSRIPCFKPPAVPTSVGAGALSSIPCIMPTDVSASIASLVNATTPADPISLAELRARAALAREHQLSGHPSLAMLTVLTSPLLSKDVWAAAQDADAWCSEIKASIFSHSTLPHLRSFAIQNKLLVYSTGSSGFVLVVPKAMVQQVISSQHDAPEAGHLAVRRTLQRVNSQFFWPTVSRDVTQYIENCRLCVKDKACRYAPVHMPAASITAQSRRFNELIAWDIQGPFRLTKAGNVYILVLSDLFSRLAISVAIPDTSAATVADMFIKHWIGHYGAPVSILSDNGSNFTSELMADTMSILSVRQVFTSPYHPQSNGVVERLNATFTSMVKKYMNADQTDWDTFLPLITRAYNTSVHETTKVSPHCVVFGSEPESILDRFISAEGTFSEHTTWGSKMRAAHDQVIDSLRSKQDMISSRIQSASAATKFFQPFSVGDIVWLRNNATVGEHKKLKHDFKQLGPYRITSSISLYSFWLEHVESKTTRKSHYTNLTMVDSKLQAQYGSTTRGEGESSAVDWPSAMEPAFSKDQVHSTTTKINHRQVTFDDSADMSSRRLSSPPPPAAKTQSKPTPSSRKVVINKTTTQANPTMRITLPVDAPKPSTSRFGRERRKPAHLLSLAHAEEGGGSDVTP
jgi:hypothetical protein